MKHLSKIPVVVALILLLSVSASASDQGTTGPKDAKYDQAVTNLLIGLQSDNLGLRESAAYMLGELECSKAVIPLMGMLHDAEYESSRIVAALALCRIKDAIGVYAVKRAAQFDKSEGVAKRCAWFYNEYVDPGSFQFVNGESARAPELASHR